MTMKRTMIQKAGAALLALCLMGTLLPTAALAEEPIQPPQVEQPQTEQLQPAEPQAFAAQTVYNVATAAEFAAAVAAIKADTESGTDFTIVLTADNIDVTQFAGIEGKHITLKSSENEQYTIGSMGTNLTGDLTLDNVTAYTNTSTIYANGHLFETTAAFKTANSNAQSIAAVYGGGNVGNDVTGDTNLVLRGGSFALLYGGGKNSNVSGSTHITLEGDAATDDTYGSVWGGGYADGNHISDGCVGGNTHINFISGTLGKIHGGGENNTNQHNTHRETAARVDGDTFVIVGSADKFDAPAPSADLTQVTSYVQGACLTATDLYGGGSISSVGNITITLEDGAYLCQKDNPNQTKSLIGGGESDIVRGTIHITVNGGVSGDALAGGSTWSSYGIHCEIQNQQNAEYASKITVNGGWVEDLKAYGQTVSMPTGLADEQIKGNVRIEFNGGVTESIHLARELTEIHGDSSAVIRGGQILNVPCVQGFESDYHVEVTGTLKAIFDGCGKTTPSGQVQYAEFTQIHNVEKVELKNHAKVSLVYLNLPYPGALPAFYNVTDLTIQAGSALALDAPATIAGDLILDGTFASAREVMDDYANVAGLQPNTVYPALLTVGGVVSGGGDVLAMKPAKWLDANVTDNESNASTPIVGETYIAAQKNASPAGLSLKNTDKDLYLKRADDPAAPAAQELWQIATGRVVTFDKNGGDTEAAPKKHLIEIPDESVTYYAALPTTLPTRAGYTFTGWNTAENGSGTAFTDKTPVAASLTVYAQWAAIPTYAVTYTDGVDGEEVFADQTTSGLAGGAATPVFSGTPTRSGYTFTGWSPAVVATVTANATYTAQWSRNSSGGGDTTDYYTLTYASNGGTKFPSQTYAEGTRVQLDKLPVREGYTFTGWYGDKELTQKRTEVRMDRSKTVYAGWQAGTVPEALNGKDHFAYVVGYTDGMVRPLEDISRAEVATIFFRLLKEEVRSENLTKTNRFADIQPEAWHNTPISTMAALGVVKGRGETVFDPDASITRAEFATICARFDTGVTQGSSNFTDVAGHWAQAEIERAAALGWIQGYTDGSFRPDAPITRAEAMTLINRVLCRIPESESDLLKDMTIWPDNQPGVWYYLAVQEATNGHDYRYKGEIYEEWVKLIPAPDWSKYEGGGKN